MLKYFYGRKKRLMVQAIMRRAIDRATPNKPPAHGDVRGEGRSNRTVVAQIVPIIAGKLALSEAVQATTKDLSGEGAALVVDRAIDMREVVVGLLLDGGPTLLRGEVRQVIALGGDFWQVGVKLLHVVSPDEFVDYADLCKAVQAMRA
jgi:hypothetical protein